MPVKQHRTHLASILCERVQSVGNFEILIEELTLREYEISLLHVPKRKRPRNKKKGTRS